MFPGLTPADCQAAAFRHDQLVNEGQRQQLASRVSDNEPCAAVTSAPPRLRFSQVLRRAGLGLTRGQVSASAATPRRSAA